MPFYKNFIHFSKYHFPSFLCHFVIQNVPHTYVFLMACIKISQEPHLFIYNFNAFPMKLRNSFLTRIYLGRFTVPPHSLPFASSYLGKYCLFFQKHFSLSVVHATMKSSEIHYFVDMINCIVTVTIEFYVLPIFSKTKSKLNLHQILMTEIQMSVCCI